MLILCIFEIFQISVDKTKHKASFLFPTKTGASGPPPLVAVLKTAYKLHRQMALKTKSRPQRYNKITEPPSDSAFIFSANDFGRVSEGTFRIICITHYHLINKNLKKLFSKVWHCVLCSAVVMNLVGRRLPPASYQHQNIFYRTSKLSRRKNSENREQSQVYLNYAEVHLSVSDVFAFTDFTA